LRAALRFRTCRIGSIVLRMPEKTHRRTSASCDKPELLLERFRRLITERRMQTTAIVVVINEDLDVSAQVLEIHISVGVDLFPLERLHKAFTTRIVVGVGRPNHAGNHLM